MRSGAQLQCSTSHPKWINTVAWSMTTCRLLPRSTTISCGIKRMGAWIMSDEQNISLAFAAAEAYSAVDTFATSSLDVDDGARRLEGVFYGSSGYRALRAMQHSGFQMVTVGELARVLWFGPFSRTYERG